MFDKVLAELKKPNFAMDVNGLDISSGMTIMHFACAGGSVVGCLFVDTSVLISCLGIGC